MQLNIVAATTAQNDGLPEGSDIVVLEENVDIVDLSDRFEHWAQQLAQTNSAASLMAIPASGFSIVVTERAKYYRIIKDAGLPEPLVVESNVLYADLQAKLHQWSVHYRSPQTIRYVVQGDRFEGAWHHLCSSSREDLLNTVYNMMVENINESQENHYGSGNDKRIPYMGWIWRETDFAHKQITIGKTLDVNGNVYVGVMEDNKWGYPERRMTETEVDTFIEYIDRMLAMRGGSGNALDEITQELHNWMNNLPF